MHRLCYISMLYVKYIFNICYCCIICFICPKLYSFNGALVGLQPFIYDIQKQLSRGVFTKRCSENWQLICRRTPMPKCDFNKVAFQRYWNHTSAWVFSCKFAAYFHNSFSFEHFWKATSGYQNMPLKVIGTM